VSALRIIKPGPLVTVQDLGRPGWGRFGVSPSGTMDPLAARAANALAGNAQGAALLELTGPGGEIEFEGAAFIALGGADLGAELTAPGAAASLAPFRATPVAAGQRVRFVARRRGARAYLAVAGGLTAPLAFGSAATDLAAGLGGALRAGERVALANPAAPAPARAGDLAALLRCYQEPDRLRFVAAAGAAPAAVEALAAGAFSVSPRSSRTGYVLDGPPVAAAGAADLLSDPIAPGAIQLPPRGGPILLMADRQTVGGYPVVGYLAAADVPRAAQLWPQDPVRFAAVSVAEAQAALRAQEAMLAAALAALAP
jgi:antagonist of KipI